MSINFQVVNNLDFHIRECFKATDFNFYCVIVQYPNKSLLLLTNLHKQTGPRVTAYKFALRPFND